MEKKKETKLYIPIAGTWARKKNDPGSWYKAGSVFDRHLALQLGYTRVPEKYQPNGFWSGDLNGLFIQKLFAKSEDDWKNGGRELARFIVRRQDILAPAEEVVLIAHSHGGQVVAFALQMLSELPLNDNSLQNIRVVTVDMPVRSGRILWLIPRGMTKTYKIALTSVAARWTHLYSDLWTWIRIWGSRGGPRRLAGACQNIQMPGGHSGVLSQQALMHQWNNYLKPCP